MSVENTLNNVLVAIDPMENEQHALGRARMMNEFVEGGIKIHLFIALEQEKLYKIHDAQDYFRDATWVNELIKPLVTEKIEHTAEVIWTENWHVSILEASKRCNADMIIFSDYRKMDGSTDLSSSKWALLRDSDCPVLIVNPSSKLHRKTILAAVNMQTDNPRYAGLNKKIINLTSLLADKYCAEKHIVNSCDNSEDFPDRAMLINNTDAQQENIHVEIGNPIDVIAKIADDIEADVVVIGTIARKGVMAAIRGNKSEGIIRKLNRDVMVINSTPN